MARAATEHAAGAETVHTVQYVAEQLELHPKTVLRFIREGRLKATRIGKSWRIRRSEIARLAGVSPKALAPPAPEATVTAIVDIPGVTTELAPRWARTVTSALNGRQDDRPLHAEVIYDPQHGHLKIIVVGTPSDAVHLLGLIRVWTEQLVA